MGSIRCTSCHENNYENNFRNQYPWNDCRCINGYYDAGELICD